MLAHFLEEEGLATTQISLIRLHSEKTKPPRALWVPFELGRPLGAPNNPTFQRKVLQAALKLLEATNGPVLEDFPEEAPASVEGPAVLACPYAPKEETAAATEAEKLCQCFEAEMASLRAWYGVATQKHQRTTVGVSKLSLEQLADFLCAFLLKGIPQNPKNEIPFASEVRYAADDLKAYYNEAVTSQPGMETSDSGLLAEWFWKDTFAGKVLRAVREVCMNSGDPALQRAAIVPLKYVPAQPPGATQELPRRA